VYRAHLALLTVEVESPIRRKRFLLTSRQADGVARLLHGGKFTQRQLQQHLQMSLGGANQWVRTMYRAGLFRVKTVRGRHGYTLITPVRGIRRHGLGALEPNVQERSSTLIRISTVETGLNISPLATAAEGRAAWSKLRGLFG
jgi:hypothetical protein